MNTIRISNSARLLLAVVLTLGIALPAAAESAAELLERGLYTEETVGDLDAAIEIYSRVVENAEANRPHVAQAQFRLGICHLKRGNDAAARAALDNLIREFPEQQQLVAQARERLATVQPALALGLVPWQDGESLDYQISLTTGKVIGSLHLGAQSTVVEGIAAWLLEQRKFAVTAASNHGVSRILVHRHSQQPISSTFRHGVLGNAEATYGVDGVEVRGGAADTHVDGDVQVYDNEQSLHLMRLLPLAAGYKVKISFLPTWAPEIIEAEIEVLGEETCTVPAGEFECFKVQIDTGQTVWISTSAERYPLKIVGGGAIIELAKIDRIEPGAPVTLDLTDFGFSVTLPEGWWSHEMPRPDKSNSTAVRLLDAAGAGLNSLEVDRCPHGRCPGLLENAKRELAGAERRFEGYQVRQDSWSERTIDGRPLISFVGDFERDGNPWVQYRLYTFVEKVRLEFIFRTPLEKFAGLQAAFDSVVEGIAKE